MAKYSDKNSNYQLQGKPYSFDKIFRNTEKKADLQQWDDQSGYSPKFGSNLSVDEKECYKKCYEEHYNDIDMYELDECIEECAYDWSYYSDRSDRSDRSYLS